MPLRYTCSVTCVYQYINIVCLSLFFFYCKYSCHVQRKNLFMFFFFFNKMFRKTSLCLLCKIYEKGIIFRQSFVTHFIDSSSRLSHKINKYTVNSNFVRLNYIVLVQVKKCTYQELLTSSDRQQL